jgi:hypothetical protein
MRINRETLLRIADDTIAQRARKERGLLSAYLTGTLLGDDYLLGGTGDIDLAFIHLDPPAEAREIVRLTDEIHMDIAHYEQKEFRRARELRLHPWLGPTIFNCKVLYDPQHFLDFTQASVRGQFNRAETVLGRARSQAGHARQIWQAFALADPAVGDREKPEPDELSKYLRAVDHAANAIASLSGPPLTERRMLLDFPQRAAAVGRPGLYPAFLGMLGAPNVDAAIIRSWLPDWQWAYDGIPAGQAPARLHPHRRLYYQRAIESLLNSPQPQAALWPMLRTWTLAASLLPESAPGRVAWVDACQRLGLAGEDFNERVRALDAFLDMVEETLERWAAENGAE